MRKIFTLTILLCTTVMALNAQIFYEDFESGFAGWTAENLWEHGSASELGSNAFNIPDHTLLMAVNDDAAGTGTDGTGRLISPSIDLTGTTEPILSFDAFFRNLDYGGADETAKVLISTDGGANWEEVKNLVGDGTNWVSESVELSAYAGQTIVLAFDFNDGGGWNYGMAIDDVKVFEPKALDAVLSGFRVPRFLDIGTTVPVSVDITNNGTQAINYIEVSWSDGTNTYTEMLNGLNIAPFSTYTYNHPVSFDGGTEVKQYDLTAWVANPNLGTDEDATNDQLAASVSFLEDYAPKVVVGEEATGTWCPWCPRGEVFLKQLINDYPDQFIGIAVHNADPMANAEYDGGIGSYISGYPNTVLNRTGGMDPADTPAEMPAQLNRIAPASITGSADYIDATGELKLNIAVTAYTEIRGGGLNVSAVIVENNMSGTASNWGQANAYAGGNYGPMGGYEDLPNPVPASQMVYDHVGRYLIGGFNGDPAMFPGMMDAGETGYTNVTYNVPSDVNVREMEVVFLLIDPESGEIYNGGKVTPGGIYPMFETSSVRGCTPFEVTFSDMSDSTTSYAWTFEGGEPATSTEANPTVTFADQGYHDVSLTAVTMSGNTYNITLEEHVYVDGQSTADFEYMIENDAVKFDNNSSNAFNYTWDFGDGNTSGSPNPTYSYAASGVYTVTLTARNGTCEDVHTDEVTFIISSLEDVLQDEWSLTANPNPFTDQVIVNYDLGSDSGKSQLVVYNYMGQELYSQNLNNQVGTVELGADLPQGIFFVQVRQDQKISKMVKITKVN